MSMDDTYALAHAIVTGGRIVCGEKKNIVKAWVCFATIHCDYRNGEFSGSVNYLIDGEESVRIEAFHNMWMQGWRPEKRMGRIKP